MFTKISKYLMSILTGILFGSAVLVAVGVFYSLQKFYLSFQSIHYKILGNFSHDKTAFTEGLVFDQGFLYESTGLYGHSRIIKTSLNLKNFNHKKQQAYHLPKKYFGEGITIIGNKLYQLTYKSKTGFVYDKNSLKLKQKFYYHFEGWGLTTDGKYLIASDGSSILHFINPNTFQEIKKIEVTYQNQSVRNINELEYIDGKIFANIWQTHFIAIINPKTGQIIGWINLMQLLVSDTKGYINQANGIAYDKAHDRLFITGKLWPKIYVFKKTSTWEASEARKG